MTTSRIRTTIVRSALAAAGALAASLALSSCSMNRISLDGTIETESRTVADFTGIELNDFGTVQVTVGPEATVTVTADTALLPRLRTEVRDGVLAFNGLDSGTADIRSVVYDVTVPSLSSFEISGSGDVTITGIDSDSFSVKVHGSGQILLNGQTDRLNVIVTGSGDVSADGLVADDVSVDLSGSGSILVTANATLVADLFGSGTITYCGHPTVAMEISGSGNVSRAG